MDTVTRAPMAIVLAEEGGLGVIDRGFRPGQIEAQVREIQIVKRRQHGIVPDPYTIPPDASVEHAMDLMKRSGVGTLMVQGILARDFPLVQGCVLVIALSFVVINLAVDLLYAWIDPRIRYE